MDKDVIDELTHGIGRAIQRALDEARSRAFCELRPFLVAHAAGQIACTIIGMRGLHDDEESHRTLSKQCVTIANYIAVGAGL